MKPRTQILLAGAEAAFTFAGSLRRSRRAERDPEVKPLSLPSQLVVVSAVCTAVAVIAHVTRLEREADRLGELFDCVDAQHVCLDH